MDAATTYGTDTRPRKSLPGLLQPVVEATQLLAADHRRLDRLFIQYARCRTDRSKSALAHRICAAVVAHAALEEELFYPALLAATGDAKTRHQAGVEHDTCLKLVQEIEQSAGGDSYLDARIQVLGSVFRHHVHEEEKHNGMFAVARGTSMDLHGLGQSLKSRLYALQRKYSPFRADTVFPPGIRHLSPPS